MGITKQIYKEIKVLIQRDTSLRGKSCLILGVQRLKDDLDIVYKTDKNLFNSLGIENVYSLSVNKKEKAEYRDDLNYPVNINKTFDYIFDIGTLEHCFNLGMVMVNLSNLLNINGVIVHVNPPPGGGWDTHGYVAFTKHFYRDFYSTNGFKLLTIKNIKSKNGRKHLNYVEARKLISGNISFPIEGKYKKSEPS